MMILLELALGKDGKKADGIFQSPVMFENHCYAIALHFVYYSFCKIHKSLSITPAMQTGLTKRVLNIEDIANLAQMEAGRKKKGIL